MSEPQSVERAGKLTDEALQRSGLPDMRPLYRKLLQRLKSRDPGAFREATRRYEEELVPAVASGEAEPLAAWIEYGGWIAECLGPGDLVAIDATGRATTMLPGSIPDPGLLLLHIPNEDRLSAVPLAIPREPSEPQRAATELLVR